MCDMCGDLPPPPPPPKLAPPPVKPPLPAAGLGANPPPLDWPNELVLLPKELPPDDGPCKQDIAVNGQYLEISSHNVWETELVLTGQSPPPPAPYRQSRA